MGSGIQDLVQKTHGSHHTPDNRTQRGEKGNISFSISLHNFDVQWGDLVKEKNAGETSAATGTDMPHVFCDAVLIGLDGCPVLILYQGWNNLEVILVHSITIFNDTPLVVELVCAARKFLSKSDLVDDVCHIELLECTVEWKPTNQKVRNNSCTKQYLIMVTTRVNLLPHEKLKNITNIIHARSRMVLAGSQVEAPASAIEGDDSVNIASLALIIIVLFDRFHLPFALFDLMGIRHVPTLAFVGPLDIVASIATLSLLSGSVTAPTALVVVIGSLFRRKRFDHSALELFQGFF